MLHVRGRRAELERPPGGDTDPALLAQQTHVATHRARHRPGSGHGVLGEDCALDYAIANTTHQPQEFSLPTMGWEIPSSSASSAARPPCVHGFHRTPGHCPAQQAPTASHIVAHEAIAEALADDETPAHATLEDGPYPCTASRPMNRTTAGFAIIFAAAFFGRKRQTRSPSAESLRHSGLYRRQGGLHIICRSFYNHFLG